MSNTIEILELTKKFGRKTAVDHVSFSIAPGEIFGLLGPNGSGKTTLTRMLCTILKPTSGNAYVAGKNISREAKAIRKLIGVVPQALTTDLDLTAWENLDIYGQFYAVPKRERKEKTESLLELVGLTSRAHDLVATYSGGMRRRLEMARGLIHQPQVLFLDEPTLGLDPQSRHVIWEILGRMRQQWKLTILLTTHYMDEAEYLCHRVAIIDSGKIIVLDTPAGLKKDLPGKDIVEMNLCPALDPKGVEDLTAKIPGLHRVEARDGLHSFHVDEGSKTMLLLIDILRANGHEVEKLTVRELSLEDVFIHYTGRSIREEEPRKISWIIGAGMPKTIQ
jgi:ABC-2 type transport system ATP-binding protein